MPLINSHGNTWEFNQSSEQGIVCAVCSQYCNEVFFSHIWHSQTSPPFTFRAVDYLFSDFWKRLVLMNYCQLFDKLLKMKSTFQGNGGYSAILFLLPREGWEQKVHLGKWKYNKWQWCSTSFGGTVIGRTSEREDGWWTYAEHTEAFLLSIAMFGVGLISPASCCPQQLGA